MLMAAAMMFGTAGYLPEGIAGGSFGISASAITSGTCDKNLTWTLDGGTLTISGEGDMLTGKSDQPKNSTGMSWGDAPWYEYRSSIKNVVIEEGVTDIGYWAFYNCTAMTSITIPNTVTEICVGAFENCTGLKSVTIPDSVTKIDEDAFLHCTNLTDVTLGKGVSYIGKTAFTCSSKMKSITLNSPDTTIWDYGVGYYNGNYYYTWEDGAYVLNTTVVKKISGFTLYFPKGSNALKYAQQYGINYEYVELPHDHEYTDTVVPPPAPKRATPSTPALSAAMFTEIPRLRLSVTTTLRK